LWRGNTAEKLNRNIYSRYVGIDVSQEAINRAATKRDEKTLFIKADVNNYIPNELFDVIVFNESLYYFNDAIEVLKRYESYLKKEGIFIILMVVTARNKSIWRRLESLYQPIDETIITGKSKVSYICKVYMGTILEK
jgi:trans-aconitate methyltransferase